MKLIVKALVAWAFLSASAMAQTAINAARSGCRGDQAQLYAELPARIGAATVLVPVCVAFGSGFSIDTTVSPAVLRVGLQQSPQPWLAMDRIDLAALPSTEGPTLLYTLSRSPMDGSALLAVLQGRPYGLVDAAVTVGRQVSITLPSRPFAPGDVIVLVYLTTESRPTGAVVVPTPAPR